MRTEIYVANKRKLKAFFQCCCKSSMRLWKSEKKTRKFCLSRYNCRVMTRSLVPRVKFAKWKVSARPKTHRRGFNWISRLEMTSIKPVSDDCQSFHPTLIPMARHNARKISIFRARRSTIAEWNKTKTYIEYFKIPRDTLFCAGPSTQTSLSPRLLLWVS